MNRFLLVAVLSTVSLFAACSTVDSADSARSMEVVPPAELTAAPTAELTARRAQLYEMILGIQREVEMKAGLLMGMAIHDDRAKLAELYMEARQIDRELLRRWNSGDEGAQAETAKLNL